MSIPSSGFGDFGFFRGSGPQGFGLGGEIAATGIPRVPGRGDANGVAGRRGGGADADGTLDAGVFAVACFGHAEVEGVVHPFIVHQGDESVASTMTLGLLASWKG